MIEKKEVEHIGKLARLGLTKKEILKYQKELAQILNYIEKLKEVEISGIEPTSHSVDLKNIFREDKPETKTGQEKLLALAPETKNGYLKVKSIFK